MTVLRCKLVQEMIDS